MYHTTRKSEVNRLNTNVAKTKNMFDTGSYLHPFRIADLLTGLVNFATGAIAPHGIQESLFGACLFVCEISLTSGQLRLHKVMVRDRHKQKRL